MTIKLEVVRRRQFIILLSSLIFFYACRSHENESYIALKKYINIKNTHGITSILFKEIKLDESYVYPYNVYFKVEGNTQDLDSILQNLSVLKYSNGDNNNFCFESTGRGYGNKLDMFSMNSIMSVYKQYENKTKWWTPNYENLNENYFSYYNDTSVVKFSRCNYKGRIVIQHFDANTLYVLIELRE